VQTSAAASTSGWPAAAWKRPVSARSSGGRPRRRHATAMRQWASATGRRASRTTPGTRAACARLARRWATARRVGGTTWRAARERAQSVNSATTTSTPSSRPPPTRPTNVFSVKRGRGGEREGAREGRPPIHIPGYATVVRGPAGQLAVSCKSTQLKRCSMVEMRWNK